MGLRITRSLLLTGDSASLRRLFALRDGVLSAIGIFHQLTDVGFSSDLWQHLKRHVAGQRAPRSEMSVAFSVFDLARVDPGGIQSRSENSMSKVKVGPFSVSLDGFGAGPRQDLQNPIGVRGLELHGWVFETETFQKMISQNGEMREMETFKKMTSQRGGARGIDNDFIAASFENVGAYIIGRNMFGPVRGPWKDDSWKGWWGANPLFHTLVFVLTHHARASLEMEGGTTFHFITDGFDSALSKAQAAANGKEIRIGGVSVIRQYLISGQIDEMHLAVSPVLLGEGEALFHGINLHQLGYKPVKVVAGENATHVIIKKS